MYRETLPLEVWTTEHGYILIRGTGDENTPYSVMLAVDQLPQLIQWLKEAEQELRGEQQRAASGRS
jgi:hypothetical protein